MLSLHGALPISTSLAGCASVPPWRGPQRSPPYDRFRSFSSPGAKGADVAGGVNVVASTRQPIPKGIDRLSGPSLRVDAPAGKGKRPPLFLVPRAPEKALRFRSEGRRVGKEGVCRCRSRGSPYLKK